VVFSKPVLDPALNAVLELPSDHTSKGQSLSKRSRLLASGYILLSGTYWQILTMLGMMIHMHAHWPRGLRFRPDNPHTNQILEKAGH
jgi:hypothetical protein